MTLFVPNTFTVRERALCALVDLFDNQTADQLDPAGLPYGFKWDFVLRAPLKDWAFKKERAIGVFDMHETKKDMAAVKMCSLRVALELHLIAQADDNPSVAMNALFGSVQLKIQEDYSLGGLVIDLQEVTNDMQIQNENQRHVSGVIFLNMQYRHSLRDPRRIS